MGKRRARKDNITEMEKGNKSREGMRPERRTRQGTRGPKLKASQTPAPQGASLECKRGP